MVDQSHFNMITKVRWGSAFFSMIKWSEGFLQSISLLNKIQFSKLRYVRFVTAPVIIIILLEDKINVSENAFSKKKKMISRHIFPIVWHLYSLSILFALPSNLLMLLFRVETFSLWSSIAVHHQVLQIILVYNS